MIKVKKILQSKSRDIWHIAPGETVYKALEVMADKDIGALVVLEKEDMVGIFSERDYSRKLILRGKSSKETRVEELMTKKVLTVGPENTVDECMALMKAANCRHMPVVEKNRIIGMVTMRDIMNELLSEKDIKISDLENFIHGSQYLDISNNP